MHSGPSGTHDLSGAQDLFEPLHTQSNISYFVSAFTVSKMLFLQLGKNNNKNNCDHLLTGCWKPVKMTPSPRNILLCAM